MKNRIIAGLTLSAILAGAFSVAFIINKNSSRVEASSYTVNSVPKNLDLNDTSVSNIRSYYSSLNNLSTSERQGTNLLKNLKPILKNGQKYYSYGSSATKAVWQIYEIIDRDWEKSPASAISGYNSSTNTVTDYVYGTSNTNVGSNPYIHALYVNRDVENQTKAWGNHNQDDWGINQEHVWAKSCGFDGESPAAGARGDVMHLWAGNGRVNGQFHSNYYYGYVDKTKSYTDAGSDNMHYTNLSGNLKGYSKSMGGTYTVFEPQDCDKGDIARALFYMVARYNYLSGDDSDGIDAGNPNLEIVNELNWAPGASYTSDTSTKGQMGILQDLLEWNRLDPPDEWEIHRNNLCYNNFTNNRNPFIDFPEWAEFIWGKSVDGSYSSTSTGYATPSTDTINGYNEGEIVPVTGVALSEGSLSMIKNDSTTLIATIEPSDATNKGVTWVSSNTDVATVSNGTVTAVNYGETTITVTTNYGAFTDSCVIKVVPSSISATTNKTYYVGETISKSDITVTTNDDIEITDFSFANDGYQFKYEDASSGGALTNKTFTNAIDYNGVKCSLTVQVQRKEHKTTMSDTLDKVFTGSPATNSYQEWTNTGTNSSVVYSGKNAGGNDSIQLNTTATTAAGIVTTTSEGLVTSVAVTWGVVPSNKSLSVYGKNTAYSSPADLFDSSLRGTLLGIIDASNTSITVESDYLYVGVCANGGAIYMSSITFSYVAKQTAKNVSNYIMFEDTNGQCTTKTDFAIGFYNEMTDGEKETFNTSEDYVITKGRERFTAWLKNQGKEIDRTTYEINKVNVFDSNYGNFDSNSHIIFILIASISSLTLLAVLIIKKRKLHR